MIKKPDETKQCNLRRKYMSVGEVGGAYAHHFYKFIDFLELRTLIITDLDSVDEAEKYSASYVSKGTHSSNVGLSKWFGMDGYASLGDIYSKAAKSKVSGCRRLAFKVDEDEKALCWVSVEDAFFLSK